MAKFHIGRGGKPAVCSAKKGNCPYGGESEHYSTREAAKVAIESQGLKHVLNNPASKKQTPIKEPEDTTGKTYSNGKVVLGDKKEFVSDVRDNANRIIRERKNAGDLSENEKRTEVAQRRIAKLVDSSMVRDDKELIAKLQNAVMADNSFFVNKKGQRVHVSDVMQAAADVKVNEDNNEKFKNTISAMAQDPSIPEGVHNFGGVKVEVLGQEHNEIDSNYAESLDKETLAKISKPQSYIDINKAKKNLPPEVLDQVLSHQSVANVIDGRANEKETLTRWNKPDTSGLSAKQAFEETAKNYGQNVLSNQEAMGQSKSALKAQRDEITSLIKAEATEMNDRNREEYRATGIPAGTDTASQTYDGTRNIMFPGRKHDSGVLVSERDVIDRKKLEGLVSPDVLEAVSVKRPTIDKERAKKHLPKEEYSKLFSKRAVKVREATYRKPKK